MKEQQQSDFGEDQRRTTSLSFESHHSQNHQTEKDETEGKNSNHYVSMSSSFRSLNNERYNIIVSPPPNKGQTCISIQERFRNQEQRLFKTQPARHPTHSIQTQSNIKIKIAQTFKSMIDLDKASQQYQQPFHVPSLSHIQNPNRLHNPHIFQNHKFSLYDPTFNQCLSIAFLFAIIFIIFAIIPIGAILSIFERIMQLGIFSVGIGGLILEFLWENLL